VGVSYGLTFNFKTWCVLHEDGSKCISESVQQVIMVQHNEMGILDMCPLFMTDM
jgi:hypothetical protein